MAEAGYLRQDSPQTLAEGIAEYYAANPGLLGGRGLSPEAQTFFRSHDAAHVVFGCGTALEDEAAVKIASLFGTTAGFGALKGYRLHESREIYRRLPAATILRSFAGSLLAVPRTLLRCGRQRARWPWDDFERYLAVPLKDLRAEFGITVGRRGP